MAKDEKVTAHGIGTGKPANEEINLNFHDEAQVSQTLYDNNTRQMDAFDAMVNNATIMRQELLQKMLNPQINLDFECGYPTTISKGMYSDMYKRNGIATRVVDIFPEESWAVQPTVYEIEEANETVFEVAFKSLEQQHHIFAILERADILSGIGDYGVLLVGIGDGKELSEPVDGINELTGEKVGKKEHKLLYLKPFDENVVEIDSKETDVTSPRFGLPKTYSITFEDATGKTATSIVKKVHWTRVVHLADNRRSSDVVGVPRMKKAYNYLLDIRKILGGSGEMFWRGGFPGYSFKVDPNQTLTDAQRESMKDEMRNYSQSLQRYLSFVGVEVESLSTQVSDPRGHIEAQIDAICITYGIPKRIFVGSERGELASSQDAKVWNKRIAKRQNTYVTPLVVRPFVDRLIAMGVLPEPVEYFVDWPDLNAPSDDEVATVATKRTEAMAKYVAGGVDSLIPPKEYLAMIMGFSMDEAEAIDKAITGYVNENENENNTDEELTPEEQL